MVTRTSSAAGIPASNCVGFSHLLGFDSRADVAGPDGTV
jgi:hypothetical protein